MAIIKSFTSLEQSKKLSEILQLESADYHYITQGEKSYFYPYFLSSDAVKYYDEEIKYIPCWSLGALISLLPSKFTEKGKYSETTYSIRIRKYALTEDVDVYQIAYGNYHWHEDGSCSWSDMINTGEKENLIDAVFQMIIWLNENNKL